MFSQFIYIHNSGSFRKIQTRGLNVSLSMFNATRNSMHVRESLNTVHLTYLIKCKQILLDFFTLRVISLPSEPKLHHPDAVSEMQHNPRRFRSMSIPLGFNRCRETMWPFMQAPVSFVSTPHTVQVSAPCLCSLTTGQVHRNHVLRGPIRRQESVTNSENHAPRHNAYGKLGVDWDYFQNGTGHLTSFELKLLYCFR